MPTLPKASGEYPSTLTDVFHVFTQPRWNCDGRLPDRPGAERTMSLVRPDVRTCPNSRRKVGFHSSLKAMTVGIFAIKIINKMYQSDCDIYILLSLEQFFNLRDLYHTRPSREFDIHGCDFS